VPSPIDILELALLSGGIREAAFFWYHNPSLYIAVCISYPILKSFMTPNPQLLVTWRFCQIFFSHDYLENSPPRGTSMKVTLPYQHPQYKFWVDPSTLSQITSPPPTDFCSFEPLRTGAALLLYWLSEKETTDHYQIHSGPFLCSSTRNSPVCNLDLGYSETYQRRDFRPSLFNIFR